MTSTVKPVAAKDRIVHLDILRGIAILFIFIANVHLFSGWAFTPETVKSSFSLPQVNNIIDYLIAVFVNGKWYSIFSILFGIGFAVQFENTKGRRKSFPSFFSARMIALLFFGLAHLVFVWMGDILTLYALLGFVLILFRNFSNKQLLIWAGILLFLPVVHLLVMIATNTFYPSVLLDTLVLYLKSNNVSIEMINGRPNIAAIIKTWLDTESWQQLITINIGLPLFRVLGILMEGRSFKVLACFLIGIWTGRQILHHGLLNNGYLLKKVALYGLLIGLPMNVLLAFGKEQSAGFWKIINSVTYAMGVVPLACAYVAVIIRIINKDKRILKNFAPVGQMALSNYFSQTIISITLFYGIGFGLAYALPLWQVNLLVITIFIVQVFFSRFWLSKFKFGPVEWLWRMMTYRKFIPNKKSVNENQPVDVEKYKVHFK